MECYTATRRGLPVISIHDAADYLSGYQHGRLDGARPSGNESDLQSPADNQHSDDGYADGYVDGFHWLIDHEALARHTTTSTPALGSPARLART